MQSHSIDIPYSLFRRLASLVSRARN
eukprot:IDg8036t1